jgi:Gamma-glutamyl cyclotransferase, AIG2-like
VINTYLCGNRSSRKLNTKKLLYSSRKGKVANSITAISTLQIAKITQDLSWLSAASRKNIKGGEAAYVSKPSQGFRKQHCFVCGSLVDPKTLAKVLGRAENPDLPPAKVIGNKTIMWG